ncbi:MAG: glycosyltransferase [bacterium]
MKLKNKKILFICGAKGSYVRNKLIYDFLCENNEVEKISSELNFYFCRIPILIIKFLFRKKKNFDYIFAGFFAQPLVVCLSRTTDKPIISDMFVSAYDTLCFDRKKIKQASFLGKFLFWIDKKTLDLSELVITDSKANSKYFQTIFNAPPNKLKTVYLGAQTDIFYPRNDAKKEKNNFTVFYYGSVLPLHGIDIILEAAKLTEKEKIDFILVGPIEKHFKKLINRLKLTNVQFIAWIGYKALPEYIDNANICLGGPFGTTPKAQRVIAGKTYQFAAMKKPLILGDSIANRELFTHEKNCLFVKMGDECKLAEAIIKLKNNKELGGQIAQNAYQMIFNLQNQKIKIQ